MGKVLQALRSSPLLASWSDDHLLSVAQVSREIVCEPGALVSARSDRGERTYILQEGKVALHISLRPGSRCGGEAATVIDHPGQAFGWSALVEEEHLRVRAQCVEKARLIAIDLQRLAPLDRLLVLRRLAFYLFGLLQELGLCPFNLPDLVEFAASSRF